MDKKTRYNLVCLLFALWAVVLFNDWREERSRIEAVPYSTFEQYLREGRIAEVRIGTRLVTGQLKTPDASGRRAVVSELRTWGRARSG